MNPPTASAPDWAALRADFPILDQTVHGRPLVYLDNAATTQKPRSVIEALVRYYERDNANVHRAIHELSYRATTAYEAARARAARFVNAASPEEIIFTRGTTEGINLVAYAFTSRLRPGDAILVTEMEHHSNLVPWQLLAQRTGARLLFVPVTGDEGLLDLGDLDSLLARNVKLFAFPHVSNSLGTINPASGTVCARPPPGRDHPCGRGPERRSPAGRRPGPGLRLPGLFGAQDGRSHGHRRALRPPHVARRRWILSKAAGR